MMEWISVDERLPDEGVDVLAYGHLKGYPFPHATVARYSKDHGWYECDDRFYDSYGIRYGYDIGHWMPLPALPIENKE